MRVVPGLRRLPLAREGPVDRKQLERVAAGILLVIVLLLFLYVAIPSPGHAMHWG